jgi:phosphonate transport system substrate-binding protein
MAKLILLIVLCGLLFPEVTWVQAANRPEFTLGVVNERPDRPDLASRQFGALNDYLRESLSNKVRVAPLIIAQSIEEMGDRVQSLEVDALIEGVMPTLSVQRRTHRIEPALLVWRKGQRHYQSLFFVRKDSGIETLSDLRARTIAFEAPRSTSAYSVPRATIKAAGLSLVPEQQADPASEAVRFVFAGSEINQAYWVERGKVDAGAFNEGDWERLPTHLRSRLHVIHRTLPLLRWLFSFRTDLEHETREAVTDVLVDMHQSADGRNALVQAERIARIERLTESDRINIDHWRWILAQGVSLP